ncbi:MAG TPA: ABC transporter permease, partial [Micromonosporaceae bacterium]|nr:ABC transporter permease [Micromonosporaceae bacterium]
MNRRGRQRGLWALAILVVAAYAFPFLYLLLTSLKPPVDAIAVPPTVLPRQFSLDNYANVLQRNGIIASFINSTTTAVLTAVFALSLAIPAAWGITRYRTRAGRAVLAGSLLVRDRK